MGDKYTHSLLELLCLQDNLEISKAIARVKCEDNLKKFWYSSLSTSYHPRSEIANSRHVDRHLEQTRTHELAEKAQPIFCWLARGLTMYTKSGAHPILMLKTGPSKNGLLWYVPTLIFNGHLAPGHILPACESLLFVDEVLLSRYN